MESILHEARFALRSLRQRPLFTAVSALSIAIGIGATTAVLGVVDALLLRAPAGITDAARVVEVGRTMDGRGMDSFSYPELLDMRAEATSLERIAGWRMQPLSVTLAAEGERVTGMLVSHDYFPILGVRPARGRLFRQDEDRTPGAHAVAVVSHRFWRERLAGDPAVVGRTMGVNRREFTIIGVAPAEFEGHVAGIRPDVYLPLVMAGTAIPGFDAFQERRANWFTAIARLAPGATLEQANAALAATFERLRAIDPQRYEQRSARAMPIGPVPGGGRAPATAFLAIILGLATIVLLVTCANVAGMMLARAAAREREIAIRLAIGAGRLRLVRQLVIESVALFAFGGVLGVLLATWAARALSLIRLPAPVPVQLDLRPGTPVLLAGLGLALATGVLFGLAPAIQATRFALTSALRNDAARRASRSGRMRQLFVVSQVALSLVLLLAAGLFLRSLQRAARIDTGFDPAGVHMVMFDLAMDGYDAAEGGVFVMALLDRVRALPAVAAASVSGDLPMDLSSHESPAWPEGYEAAGETRLQSHFNIVSDGYFETVRVPVLQGRSFTPADRAGSEPVAIVSRTFAARAWPGQDPLGQRLRFSSPDAELRTVVGVADDVKNQMLTDEPQPMVYLPHAQQYHPALTLLVRSGAPAATAAEAMRGAIRAIDPNLALTPVASVQEYTGIGLLPQRLAAWVTSTLALVAMLLAALGVYGVIAFTVAQQTREIGVRIALGALRGDVVALVVRRGLRLALPGMLFGILAGLAASRLLRSFILGVAPADPATFMLAPLTLLAVVLVATLVPARRAASIDPSRTLRAD